MKVKRVELIPLKIPLKTPFGIYGGFVNDLRHVIVKLYSSNGLIGYGEGTPLPTYSEETQETVYFSLKNYFVKCVIGEDPMDIERILSKMEKAISGHWFAKSSIEFALWDLIGKELGLPIYKLIGGLWRDKIPIAWGIGYSKISEMVDEAKTKVSEGFQVIKIKIGRDEKTDLELIKSLREELGSSIKIRVDANQAYSKTNALKILKKMEKYDLQLIEQPLSRYDLEGMANLVQVLNTPIMADESVFGPSDAMRVIKARAADVINIKIGKHGGIYNAKKVAAIAESANIPCQVGSNVEFAIGTAAGAHLAASTKNVSYECELIGPATTIDDISKKPYLPRKGYLELPKGKGLGISIDENKLEKYRNIIKV